MVSRSPIAPRAVVLLGLALAACRGTVASYPDAPGVTAAQAEWCAELAKIHAAGGAWEHTEACKKAETTASAEYLRRMSKCFSTRVADLGSKAPDNSQLVSECNDEVTVAMHVDAAATREIVAARCQRKAKCEKVAEADCRAAFDRLETAQQAMLSSTYNQAALHDIADCLVSSSCAEDEEGAQNACYKPAGERLLWFPG